MVTASYDIVITLSDGSDETDYVVRLVIQPAFEETVTEPFDVTDPEEETVESADETSSEGSTSKGGSGSVSSSSNAG